MNTKHLLSVTFETRLISVWMRGHAGEQLWKADAAADNTAFPLIALAFSHQPMWSQWYVAGICWLEFIDTTRYRGVYLRVPPPYTGMFHKQEISHPQPVWIPTTAGEQGMVQLAELMALCRMAAAWGKEEKMAWFCIVFSFPSIVWDFFFPFPS